MNYIEHLNWRYATKQMNGNAIPAEKLDNILEAIRLAPTSIGLQAFEVFVIEDAELKAKLSPAMYNQPQINQSGAVLIFAARKNFTEAEVDAYMQRTADTRNVPVDKLVAFKAMIMGSLQSKSPEQQAAWLARQTYIALGVAVTAAAIEKVDNTPMEGFDNAQVDEILGLAEKGLFSTVALTLGYRDEEKDVLANAPKVRRSSADMFNRFPAAALV